MQRKKRRLKAILTVINIFLIVFSISSTIAMLIPVTFHQIYKQDRPIFGNYLYINNNNNLIPVMKKNDLVIVKPISITELTLGDFLCYYSVEDTDKSALFGKIVGFSDEELELSDKAGHSTTVKLEDMIVVGKATNIVVALGDIITFFHSPANRLLFYIIVGATALIFAGITIMIHVVLNSKNTAPEIVTPEFPVSYKLEELIQIEEDSVDFEKAPSKQELLHD